MGEIMKIGNQEITVKEYKGQRVVTFKDIDLCHERPEGTAKRNFNTNAKHFIDGEDFFKVSPSEIRTDKIMDISSKAHQDVTLITQQGYMMLTKSLTDDLAWKVQRELVNGYFSKPQEKQPSSPMEILELEFKAIKEVDGKVEKVNADLQAFKREMPILGVEESRITCAAKKKGVECLGGKKSAAYQDKSIRNKLYADIYRQLKREFGVTSYKAIKRNQCDHAVKIIENYRMPYIIEDRIKRLNDQMVMDN
jgi:hypothetical protein